MPDSREFDVRWLPNLFLPFDAQSKELTDGPRIVAGSNMFITPGGKIAQAPGLNDTDLTSYTITGRVDRLIVYETIEPSPKVFILASVFDGTDWDVRYLRLSAAVPAWTSIGSLRGVNASIYPHEFVVARGLCFIRFSASNQPAGVIVDGTGGTITLTSWGLDGSANPPGYSGNFGVTTTNAIFGWRYAYAYVNSVTGHVSSRSPASVSTGPIINSNPRITGAYTTDTTVDFINIYRTSDGGGTLYFLFQIANNTAGGNFTFNDDDSAIVAGDAKQDSELDTRNIAPSEVSNEPVPRSSDGSAPTFADNSTPLAYFARRIWFGVGNRLVYSGQEEILNGVPEESFPNPYGIRGNYYLLQGHIRQVKAARRSLYVTTANETLILTGQDKSNFFLDTHVPDIAGGSLIHPSDLGHAAAAFRDSIFFMSADYQIYRVTGSNAPELISGPLGTELSSIIRTGFGSNSRRVEFEIYSRDGLVWLIVNVAHVTDPAFTRQFVYDLERNIWFTPWSKPINTMTFGRLNETTTNRFLIVMTYNGTTSKLAVLDFDYLSDVGTNFTPTATINLSTIPAGNHINELRKWAHTPVVSYIILERTKITSDTDPTVTYRLDEFSGSATSVTASDPPYLSQHTSYKEHWYPLELAAKRIQIIVAGTAGQRIEIQNLGTVFHAEAGA